jgi:L-threonylcarbamoyladenylate synthase
MDNHLIFTNEVIKAAEIVKNGGLILYPTDTIWGIGCDATNYDAVERIFQIKKRDSNKSMIVLMKDYNELKDYLKILPQIDFEQFKNEIRPLTVIYQHAKNLAENVIAKDGSIAIRIPKDDFCNELIKSIGVPLVSTSANFSGEPSAENFKNISEELKYQVDYIVNYAQDLVKDAKPSRIIKIMDDGKIIVIRE